MKINNDDIIVFDTETTGLDAAIPAKIEVQPYITEFYAVRMSKDFNFISEVDTFIKPPIPITDEITKITGISDETVKDAPTFLEVYDEIYDLFCGVRHMVGHNIGFDQRLLKFELFRHNKEYNFNWPKEHICTVEKSYHYENKRLKLQQLYQKLFGVEFANAHRAKNDVNATKKCFIEMVKRGDIKLK